MPTRLKSLKIREGSLVDVPANPMARVVLFKRGESMGDMTKADEKPTKQENGYDFPASAYAYVPDPEKPSTWKLRLWETPEKKETPRQVGMAVAALGPGGFRGNRVQIPSEDLPKVKAKVRAAWKKVNPDKSEDEMPQVLKGGDKGVKSWREKLAKLFGFDDDDDGGAQLLSDILEDEKSDELIRELTWALGHSIDTILDDDTVTDKQSMIRQTIEEYFQALVSSGVVKAGRKISADRLNMLKEMHQRLGKLIEEAEGSQEGGDGQVDANKVDGKHDIGKGAGSVSQVPEGIQKRMEELEKRAQEWEERAKKAEEIAKAEREQRLLREYVAKAAEFRALGINPEEFGAVLKSLAEKAPEEYQKVEAMLKAADETVSKSALFGEIGRTGSGAAPTAFGKVEQMAAEIAKSEGITKEKAITKIMREHPDLYAEYRREIEGRLN